MDERRRPRGRRPGENNTRETIMQAARRMFTKDGYDAVSLRAIAREAGVDPALIHHYFQGKSDLYIAVSSTVQGPGPTDLMTRLITGTREQLGRRTIETFFMMWETDAVKGRFRHMWRETVSTQDGTRALREFLNTESTGRICAAVSPDRPGIRADLLAGLLISLGLIRYHLELEAIRAASQHEVVALYAPIVQHILVGDLTADVAGPA